jgi:hypothetical protein
MTFPIRGFEWVRSYAVALPPLAKFALGMVVISSVPALSRRVQLPAVVWLLLSGTIVGPHVVDIFGDKRPIAYTRVDKAKGGAGGGAQMLCKE